LIAHHRHFRMAAVATAEPSAIQVGLCGRAARVELRPDEGLNELRTRVANAFGLTAPFDLINSQGVPMRTDMDTILPRAGGALPEITIDAGEELLLDLEHAHEETGAIRWVMLRKVLAGLRRQVAEAHAGIADSQHRAAILDEQLVRERSSREAADSAASSDLRGLVRQLEDDIKRSQREAQAALKASAAEMHRSFEESLKQLAIKCTRETADVAQELQTEKEVRNSSAFLAAEGLVAVQAAVKEEAEVREKELQLLREAIAGVQASVGCERSERLISQTKVETDIAELGVRLLEEQSLRDHAVRTMKESLGEAQGDLHREGLKREEALEAASKHIQEVAAKAEADLKIHEVAFADRLDELAKLEGMIVQLTDQERSERQIGDGSLAATLEDLTNQIGSLTDTVSLGEQRLQRAITEAVSVAESGRSSLEQKIDVSIAASLASLQSSIEAERLSRGSGMDAIRQDVEVLDAVVQKFKMDNEVAFTAVAAAQDSKREEAMQEVRRMHKCHSEEQREWARLLVEQLSKDLRTEHEALQLDNLQRGQNFALTATEHVKVELLAEVSRIDSSAADRKRLQDAAMSEYQKLREAEAQQTASEVRECLTSHSDFMEALEREQQILINRLNEGLAFEDQKREGLGQRIQGVESDMHKVKGHLPILFAVPTAFR